MRVFLSYRREDSAAWAGRLHDSLAARFGERNIFQDVVAVEPGEDFADRIDRAMTEADAALAMIGPSWLTVTDDTGTRRLDQPDDYVRSELAAALVHGVKVIPVLVGGAAMPTPAQLPDDLQALAQRQAVTLRDTHWRVDADALVAALRGERPGARRRWPLIAAVVVAVLAVAGVVTALLLRNGDDSDGSDDSSVTGCPEPPQTGLNEFPLTDPTPLTVDGSAGVTIEYDVEQAFQRQESDGWDAILVVGATNSGETPLYSELSNYQLAVDNVPYRGWCINQAWRGDDPLKPGLSNVTLVGFEKLPTVPAESELALLLDLGATPGRIELSGATD
jgi:hypothetical protein